MDKDFSEKLGSILSDPEMMSKIKTIAASMTMPQKEKENVPSDDNESTNVNEEKSETKALPVGNFGMPNVNSELIKNISNSRALLCALKPYLDKERCERIDKILGMMKIAEIMGYIK